MNYVENAWGTSGPIRRYGQDWYAALHPITCFARILGIFPLSLRGPVGGKKYRTNTAFLIHSAVVCILLVTGCVMTDHPDEIKTYLNTNMERLILQCFKLTYVSSLIVVFVTVVFAKEKMAITINNMCAQDEALEKFGIRFDYAAAFKHSCIRLGAILLMIVTFSIFDFASMMEHNSRFLIMWMVRTSVRSVRIMNSCLFAEMILVLREKFTAINENLEKIIDEIIDSPLQTVFKRVKMCERIRSIVRIHGAVSKSASSLNQIYGIVMVIGVGSVLLSLISISFYIITRINHGDISVADIATVLSWGLLECGDNFYVMWTCIVAQNQASYTAKLIHKLNGRELDSQSVIDTTIQSCSLQLHHSMVKFTCAGLFPYDATVIRSLVGAVVTYLVIVLQFNTAKP